MPPAEGSKKYSIAEARNQLARIIHDAEAGALIELTRRGEPVAVLVSAQEYQRFRSGKPQFWKRLSEFRKRIRPEKLNIRPEDWEGLRNLSSGRKVEF